VQLQGEDLKKDTYRWRNTETIYKWCRQNEPLFWENHSKWFDSLPSRDDVKMKAIQIQDNKTIGVCGLTSIDLTNRRAEFSLYIAPDYQGMGHGQKALISLCKYGFDVLGLHHIFGETYDGNPAATMFEKVGFKKEGTRRQFYFRNGQFIDCHLYSILRGEI
jgi:ribosomal protein S18 acetylase RimI-like enzyme